MAVLLGMTLIPAVLVLLVGSELIRNSVDRWFNAPMDDVLSSANTIAGDYYQERQRLVARSAQRLARAVGGIDLASALGRHRACGRRAGRGAGACGPCGDLSTRRDRAAAASTARPGGGRRRSHRCHREFTRESATRLAERVASGSGLAPVVERLPDGGDLIRSAVEIRARPGGPPQGVVIASEYITAEFAARARRMTQAYEDYQQLRVLKQPLAGVYLSFFLMLTLMILVAATWMGLYLAKRITRPVQMLAAAANEIGAGHLDHRVEAGDQRRVRIAYRGIQPHGGGSVDQPTEARTFLGRARAETSGRRGTAALRGDDPRAHRDWSDFRRHRRPRAHVQRRRVAPARARLQRVRSSGHSTSSARQS